MATVPTIAQIHTIFSLLADKYGTSAALDPSEIDNFINQAQILILRDYINNQYGKNDPNYTISPPNKQQSMAIEDSVISALNVTALHSNVTLTSSGGYIALSTIEDTFPDDPVLGGKPAIEYIQKSATRDGVFARWRANNDTARQDDNVFKKPTAVNPRWTYDALNIQCEPTTDASWSFDVWRAPRWVSLDDDVTIQDFAGDTINTIIFRGLQLAGISIRDTDLTKLMDAEQIKQ